ncbi:NAD(P)H-hydrate dehydratase [uncultured Nitrospira sp.]|uniref:NAD(P)H-hydrate dehydratase n=1 Tax=uncultured Nitrospira sp. TaxID=157176 RepID=UPI00313FFD84
MWVVTAEQMQTLDRRTIQEAKVPGITLMERAGAGAMAQLIEALGSPKGKKVVILCGKGNNGGDGLVVARLLAKKGAKLKVVLMAPLLELSPDAKIMYQRLSKVIKPSLFTVNPSEESLHSLTQDADILVDALLGTGLSSLVRPPYSFAIEAMNASQAFTLAIDIPSGLDSNTGALLGVAVQADLTVTFGCPKIGLYLGSAIDKVGKIQVIDIGIPKEFVLDLDPKIHLLSQEMARPLIPLRNPSSHKGTFGHAGIVGGSQGKTGAPAMAGLGALRIGTGLVTVATPQSVSPILESKLLEVMTEPMPESSQHLMGMEAYPSLLAFAATKSALAFGPGMGISPETTEVLRHLLPQLEAPCVLDADALNGLAQHCQIFSSMKIPPILTPHPGEMARLLAASSPKQVNEDRIGVSRQFAMQHQVILVLKGARTIIAEPHGQVAICPTGNPGMASAGMGDVLTGIITGLLAQGLSGWDAARAGVYLHGLAGDLAATTIGEPGLIAGDVLTAIPHALTQTLSHS